MIPFLVIILAAYAPFVLLGANVYEAISVFLVSNRPLFNGGTFSVIEYLLGVIGFSDPVSYARLIAYTIFVVTTSFFTIKILKDGDDALSLMKYSAVVITVYLALSATMQPWYLAWVFPFLVFFSSWSWLLFSFTIFLTYFTYSQQPISAGYWKEILWIKVLEYSTLYSMLIYEIIRNKYMSFRSDKRLRI